MLIKSLTKEKKECCINRLQKQSPGSDMKKAAPEKLLTSQENTGDQSCRLCVEVK